MSGIFGNCNNNNLTIQDANIILGNLRNCAGAPHQIGDSIPTCEEMDVAITDAIAAAALTEDDIAQVFRTCAGVDHVPEALIPTCAEMTAAIAASVPTEDDIASVFRTCAGADHVPNANIPTCAEMEAAIAEALTGLPGPTGPLGFRAGDPTTGTDPLVGDAVGAVTRTFLDKARETVSVFDFGVVGDNSTDDTGALQAAIDFCDATGKILDFGTAKMRTTGPVTAVGSFGGIVCADAFAGIYPEGSGYTAITIGIDSLTNPGGGTDGSASFRTNNLDLAVFGTGNEVNGILLNFISLSVVKRLRAFNLNGFGVKMDWANNSTFEHISTELCGQENNIGNGYSDVYAIELKGGLLSAEINQNTFVKIECESSRDRAFMLGALAYGNHFCSIHSERCSVTESYSTVANWTFGGSTSVFDNIQLQSFENNYGYGEAPSLRARFITANCIFNVIRLDQVNAEFETWGNPGTYEEMHTQVNSLRCEPMISQPTPTPERPYGYFSPKVRIKTDSEHFVNFNDCSISSFISSNGKQNLTRCKINHLEIEYMNAGNLVLSDCSVEYFYAQAVPLPLPSHMTAYNTKFLKIEALPSYTYARDCYFAPLLGSLTQYAIDNPGYNPFATDLEIQVSYKTLEVNGCIFDAHIRSEVGTIIASKSRFYGRLAEAAIDHSSLLDDDNWYYGAVTNFDTEPATALALVPKVGMRHYNAPPTVGQPKSWVCTDAIVPTWVTEGNL